MKKKTEPLQKQALTYNPAWAYLIIFILAFGLYGNTFKNKYALDDAIVITQNEFTRQGLKGIKDIFSHESFTGFFGKKKNLVAGGRYRPLSIATFAVEYQFFGLNPTISHIVNTVLYALTGMLIFLIFYPLLDNRKRTWWFSAAFFTSVLFIIHPIHTEVVANIKGRDEILALLFALFSLWCALLYLEKKKIYWLLLSSVMLFLGMLSKENAAVFLFLVPLTMYFFTPASFKKASKIFASLLAAFLLFLFIRQMVVGHISSPPSHELMNNPFLYATTSERYATIFYTLGLYIKLLVFPHPLTFDYYPYHVALQHWNNFWVIIPFLGYIFLFVEAVILFRTKNLVSYGIWFYLAALLPVSNLLFPVGTFMNERFVYMSSLGFLLIAGGFLNLIIERGMVPEKYVVFFFIIIPVTGFYGWKTVTRNKIWKNDYTLFTTDVKTSANSAKSNCSAGGVLLEHAEKTDNPAEKKQLLNRSLTYLHKAVSIHPQYVDAWLLLGNAHYDLTKNIDSVMTDYRRILKIDPGNDKVFNNLIYMLDHTNNVDYKIGIYRELLNYAPRRYDLNYKLGNLYGRVKNNLPMALKYLTIAASVKPDNKEVCKDLGVAYGMAGNFKESLNWLLKAVELDPNDAKTYLNIAITYQHLGDNQKASQYIQKAKQLDPSL